MGRGTLVPISPSVLNWAIHESGYTEQEVASRLKIDIETLEAWKRGQQPKLTEFKKLTTLLKRPSATFFLDKPPSTVRSRVEFRHPPNVDRSRLNPTELRYLREASRLQRALSWILRELGGEPVSLPRIDVGSRVEESAGEIRHRLGVTENQQAQWANAYEALKGWRSALEEIGVFTLLFPLGKTSCRGFSLCDDRAPIISVSTWWNAEARTYTLFHEYAHLLSRTDSACVEPGRQLGSRNGDPVERWCEELSASILMPWDLVERFMAENFEWAPGASIQDVNAVRQIARHFKVSLRAATLRLIGKRVSTWDLYSEIPTWAEDKPKGGGGGGRNRRKIREDSYGFRTIGTFLSAMSEDVISRADALDYLDIPDADLDELQRNQG